MPRLRENLSHILAQNREKLHASIQPFRPNKVYEVVLREG